MSARCSTCSGRLDHAAILCDATVCTTCEIDRIREAAKEHEWDVMVSALRTVAAEHNGTVDWTHVRPLIKGRIQHKHVGQLTKRAKRLGLIAECEIRRSRDFAGKNAGRPEPVYKWKGQAA